MKSYLYFQYKKGKKWTTPRQVPVCIDFYGVKMTKNRFQPVMDWTLSAFNKSKKHFFQKFNARQWRIMAHAPLTIKEAEKND